MERLLHGIDALLIDRPVDARANFESLLRDVDDPLAERLLQLTLLLERRERLHQRFLSTLRHEIGNPLSIAQANLEGIIDGVLEPDRERLMGVLNAVQAAGALLGDMAREPRDAEEMMPIKLESFNICALMSAHAASVSGAASAKGVQLIYRECGITERGECMNFRGDARRVGQVLQNVLLNAVRYTPPGGRIELDCDNAEGDLIVVVSDTGPGIPAAEIPHVFEAGFRGARSEKSKGSGLGLSVVADLLKKLGGSARVLSNEGEGTTFVISLPAARMELTKATPQEA
ncbi:MAG TPA: HAMP domain-containing sensor histidine kinase [Candidatus Dormibacteraeota bacterium]|nr:HAMP domain-containing sensor histidine kinase [Candidatus Dormibacteraeota bacterium]